MESFILQVIAEHFNKEAITVVTVIDNLATHEYSNQNNKIPTEPMFDYVLDKLF